MYSTATTFSAYRGGTMRKRIISATVVLGLGIVGMTLAQQIGEQPNGRTGELAKLRAEVIKLRVEIEFLEMDHDVIRAEFLLGKKQMREIQARFAITDDGEPINNQAGVIQAVNTEIKNDMIARRDAIPRIRDQFAKQAADLAEKRLELAELERRYNEAK
jgi:hypothetical protein